MAFKNAQIDTYYNIENWRLKYLTCIQPITVYVWANKCVEFYEKGVIYDGDNRCGCSNLLFYTNHCVSIIGFGQDDSSPICKKYWLVKNSWGTSWGEDGFARICREDDDLPLGTCQIKEFAVRPR